MMTLETASRGTRVRVTGDTERALHGFAPGTIGVVVGSSTRSVRVRAEGGDDEWWVGLADLGRVGGESLACGCGCGVR